MGDHSEMRSSTVSPLIVWLVWTIRKILGGAYCGGWWHQFFGGGALRAVIHWDTARRIKGFVLHDGKDVDDDDGDDANSNSNANSNSRDGSDCSIDYDTDFTVDDDDDDDDDGKGDEDKDKEEDKEEVGDDSNKDPNKVSKKYPVTPFGTFLSSLVPFPAMVWRIYLWNPLMLLCVASGSLLVLKIWLLTFAAGLVAVRGSAGKSGVRQLRIRAVLSAFVIGIGTGMFKTVGDIGYLPCIISESVQVSKGPLGTGHADAEAEAEGGKKAGT